MSRFKLWLAESPWFPLLLAVILTALLSIAGCTNPNVRPFLELEGGYHFNEYSDWFYQQLKDHPSGNQLGQPWVFRVRGGIEQKKYWWLCHRIGWEHESRLLDGTPFNNNPELYRETAVCTYKIGGF